jgi:hypothetical protein
MRISDADNSTQRSTPTLAPQPSTAVVTSCMRSGRGWRRFSARREIWLLIAAGALHCGPAPGRIPDPAEIATLRGILRDQTAAPFRGVGHGRFASREGSLEGDLTVRSDPPRRAWIEFRTGALFGLVAERVVLGLPGDDHVLVYRAREDVLDRLPFTESSAGALGLWGGVETLQSLALGCIPWPGGAPPANFETRLQARGGMLTLRLDLESGPGDLGLEIEQGRLRRWVWRPEGKPAIEVRFDRYRSIDGVERPMQVRLRAGEIEAEVEWERLEVPAQFGPGDFEVGARNPFRGLGVQGG